MGFNTGAARNTVQKKVAKAKVVDATRKAQAKYQAQQEIGQDYGGDYGADPYAVAANQIAANPGLANASDDQIIDYIRGNYSPALSRLLEIPELRSVLIDAARDPDISQATVLSRVEATSWWQSRSESQRTFDALAATDPTEFNAQVDRRMADLVDDWEAYGVDGDVREAAINSLRLGYSDNQIRQVLAETLQKESSKEGLDTGSRGAADADALMAIARNEYLMPMDRQTAERWAIKAIREGGDVTDQWRSYLGSIANSRFGIAPGSGITPADMMAPVKSALAEALELDPDSIDLLSPQYSSLLNVETKDGGTRAATYYEALKFARSDPRYSKTKNGNDLAAGLAETLSKTFGAVA